MNFSEDAHSQYVNAGQATPGVNQKKRTRVGKTPAEKIVWTSDEDEELRRLVDIYGDQSWHRLCKFMPNKTEIRCFKRWLYLQEVEKTNQKDTKRDETSDIEESLNSGEQQLAIQTQISCT